MLGEHLPKLLTHHGIEEGVFVREMGVVMILSGLFRMALITGCRALMICCATHWAAFCNQQVTSSGLRHTAAWAVAPILSLEEAPTPMPTAGVIPGLAARLVWTDA